jgi:TonB family protein
MTKDFIRENRGSPGVVRTNWASQPRKAKRRVFDLERKSRTIIPIERALLFSVGAHVVFFLFILFTPERRESADPSKGLLSAFLPTREEGDPPPIPVEFREAPGPKRESSRQSPASDLDRRAGGGDPSRPRSDMPYVPERPGMTGLAEGERGRTEPRPPEPGPGDGDEAAKSADESTEEERAGSARPFVVPEDPGKRGSGEGRLAGLDQAIREAAEDVGGAGDEGAGFPNADGGFVDSGPLSFDSAWYDWGPYAAEMVRRIKLHWDIPSLARLGWKGKLTIRFFILADGRVEGAMIIAGSGVPPFDHAALQAILRSSPFRPLPKDLGTGREGVTVTFFYNIRPERS